VRIVEVLERLNLTWEVRDGIRAHSWKIDPPPATREAECVRYADRIGYLSHDALDAIRAGVIRLEDLPAHARRVFGEPGSEMVGTMIDAVVAGSLSPGNTPGAVVMAPEPLQAMHELRAFMFERVYASETAAGQKHVAIDVIRRLVDHHLAHPELIPESYRDSDADAITQVVDYVSGMTDRFALAMHDRLFDADATSQMTPLLRAQ
jgi:dGTPase